MRPTHRLSLLRLALFAVLPFFMTDETAAASIDPNASASSVDAAAESAAPSSAETAQTEPATDAGTAPAEAASEQSQTPAAEAGTAMSGEPSADSSSATSSASADTTAPQTSETSAPSSAPIAEPAPAAPVNENTGKVEMAADAHAEAKDRFAGLLAKLHQFEGEAIDELKTDLMAIATLLHLHTRASSSAATTGDYKPADLS